MTGIPYSGTAPCGSVTPAGVCRLSPSIAVPDQMLRDMTPQG